MEINVELNPIFPSLRNDFLLEKASSQEGKVRKQIFKLMRYFIVNEPFHFRTQLLHKFMAGIEDL